MNLVMADDGRFIELQGTAENDPFSSQQLNQMLALGRRGLVQIIAKQKSVVGKLPSR
jgi:ribonuclease PH